MDCCANFIELASAYYERFDNKRFDSFIMSLRYNKLSSDYCAYYKRFDNNDFIILLLYVYDMLIVGLNKNRVQELKA